MIVCAIICFLVVAVNIWIGVSGVEYFGLAIYTGLGILLIYLKVTRKERIKKKKIRASKKRFGNSAFIAQVIQDFRNRNWDDLDCMHGGCKVRWEAIETPHQTYSYISYGLGELDVEGCELLALYLGEAYGGDYEMSKIIVTSGGGHTGVYSGYVGADGSIHISDISEARESIVGYQLRSKSSVPPPPPAGRKW